MNSNDIPQYGLWSLAIINIAIFVMFAFSFSHPKTKRDWRSFSAFSAFIVALFVEMYGFPLTLYLLAGWLGNRFPGLDPASHNAGHLWEGLFGFTGNPHLNPIHLISDGLILGGFFLVSAAWKVLYQAIQTKTLATTGPYAVIRHPQYAGFVLVMFGFLVQWPTIITLIMFPILVAMYVHLARKEEAEVRDEFGEVYAKYAAVTPAFFPHLGGAAKLRGAPKEHPH